MNIIAECGINPPDDPAFMELIASSCRAHLMVLLAERRLKKHLFEAAGNPFKAYQMAVEIKRLTGQIQVALEIYREVQNKSQI